MVKTQYVEKHIPQPYPVIQTHVVDRPIVVEREKHIPVVAAAPAIAYSAHSGHAFAASPAPYIASTVAPVYAAAPIYSSYGPHPHVDHYHH